MNMNIKWIIEEDYLFKMTKKITSFSLSYLYDRTHSVNTARGH